MRLCANVPAQHAIQTALGGHQSINDLILPGGRLLEQRDVAWRAAQRDPRRHLRRSRRARCTLFPRLDPEVYPIQDDQQFVLDLLRREKILVVQGTGFNWPTPDHFRIVTLPSVEDLEDAIEPDRGLPGDQAPLMRPGDRGLLAAIAAGGAIGSLGRYAVEVALPHAASAFPWATFLVNVSGAARDGAAGGVGDVDGPPSPVAAALPGRRRARRVDDVLDLCRRDPRAAGGRQAGRRDGLRRGLATGGVARRSASASPPAKRVFGRRR